jgi:hypothetical protein
MFLFTKKISSNTIELPDTPIPSIEELEERLNKLKEKELDLPNVPLEQWKELKIRLNNLKSKEDSLLKKIQEMPDVPYGPWESYELSRRWNNFIEPNHTYHLDQETQTLSSKENSIKKEKNQLKRIIQKLEQETDHKKRKRRKIT